MTSAMKVPAIVATVPRLRMARRSGVVARRRGLEEQPSHTGPVEDALGDGGPGDEERQERAEERHHRNEGVPQDMPLRDVALAESLGAGGSNVVLREHLEDLAADEARVHDHPA